MGRVTKDTGLEFEFVRSLAQDARGFIWSASHKGLARFDGTRSQTYTQVAGDLRSLPQTFVANVHADAAGEIWIATVSGNVARYNHDTDDFTHYPVEGRAIGSNPVLTSSKDGRIHAGGANGLFSLDVASGRWDWAWPETSGLPAGPVSAILADDRGALWVGTATGLFHSTDGGSVFSAVPGTRGRAIGALAHAADRSAVLFGTRDGILGRAAPDGSDSTVLHTFQDKSPLVCLLQAPDGAVYACIPTDGLAIIDPVSATVRRVRHVPNWPYGLPSQHVYDLMLDRSGLLWVGTQEGLARINPVQTGFLSLFPGTAEVAGLRLKDVMGLRALDNHRVLVGYQGGKASLLTVGLPGPAGAGFREEPISGLATAAVFDFLPIGPDVFLVATGQGLFRLSLSDLRAVPLSGVGPVRVNVMARAHGDIWVGTRGQGLMRIDPDGRVLAQFGMAEGLTDNEVIGLLEEPTGGLWVGTTRGLNLMGAADGAIRHFRHDPTDPHSLPSDTAGSLLIDRRGRLWVGTYDGSAAVLPERLQGKPHIIRIGAGDPLPSDIVSRLQEDKAGRIWLSPTAMVDPDTLEATHFGSADGAVHEEAWWGSGTQLPDGTLLYGTLQGISIIRPEHVRPWTFRPSVAVTRVTVDGRPRPGTGAIRMSPRERAFQVEFAALDYSDPLRNRYAYMLEGYDPDWVETNAQRRGATYTNLSPGTYRLLIRGSNRKGVWTDPPTVLAVTVLPAWYQTFWFRALAVLALIGAGFGLVQLRTSVLRQRQRELEQEVDARTREIREQAATVDRQRNELAQALSTLQATQAKLVRQEKLASLGQLVAGVAHEINTPIGVAITSASMLEDELGGAVTRMEQKSLTRTGMIDFFTASKEAIRIVRGNLDRAAALVQHFKQVAVENVVEDVRAVEMCNLIDEILALSRPILKQAGVRVEVTGTPPLMLTTCPGPLVQIVSNLIQNAVNHAFVGIAAPLIRIRLERTDDNQVRLVVEDNGTGMPLHVRDRAFDPFFTTRRGQGGTGLGLHIVHNLVTGALRGEIELDSAPGQGTRFTLLLPDLAAGTQGARDSVAASEA